MSIQQDINAIRAQRFANTHDPLALMANTQTPFLPDHSSLITYLQHQQPNNNFVQQPSFNTNYMQQPMRNPKDISDPTTAFDMALALMSKAFQLNNITPTNNNQMSSSNPYYSQIAQSGMNINQDRHMLMVDDNVENQFRPNAMQNVRNQVVLNVSQNPGVQNVGNQNGLCVVSETKNQYRNGNVVTASAEGNGNGINGIQSTQKDFEFMAAANAYEETERVKANCILENNLQQASTSGTRFDKAPVYDTNGSAEKMALGYQNHFYLKQAQQKQQSLYNGKVLLEKHDPPVVHDLEETLQLAQEKFLDDTTPSVARKFLNEVKSTIVTLQRVVKHRMTLDTHNWSSYSHQELHKIVKDEIFPIVNQVDARVQNFEIQFLKEAAEFVGDFKSLAKEADESLAKHKALELEIKRLLREIVSQDIMSIVKNNFIVDSSNLQTELDRTKEKLKNCIIKKEKEYAVFWNKWYTKCEECKYDKISYDKAYNDMQQKTEQLQAQLGDPKGKSKDTSCVSDTLNPLSQKQ
nr:hypothetical protein [Tanacetum cinerariifolium]